MDKTKILEKYLYQAVDLFYQNDVPYLVDKNAELSALERSYVFRVAHYLQNMLAMDKRYKDVIVDCEYGNATSATGEQFKKYIENLKHNNGTEKDGYVFPDLIVHKRHGHDKNLMVVEFKGYWNDLNWLVDEDKLKAFTNNSPEKGIEQHFYYKFGLFVVFGHEKAHYVKFKHGEQISKKQTVEQLQQERIFL